jgi:general secretion pathway protein D
VAVQSGETMVLGGMITDNKSRSSSGLPLLSQIPVLGALFGSQSIVDNRTELLVMITPRVVGNMQQSREVTAEIRDRMEGLKKIEMKPKHLIRPEEPITSFSMDFTQKRIGNWDTGYLKIPIEN